MARPRDAGEDDPAAQEVPGGRRHDRHGRQHRRRSATTSACRSRTTSSSARRSGQVRACRATKFYVPGSILRVAVDNTAPVAAGLPNELRRVLRRQPGLPARAGRGAQGREAGRVVRLAGRRCAAAGRGARTISTAVSPSSRRRSARASSYLFGPEITFRAQPHGTFKFLFNGIYAGSAADRGSDKVVQ